MAESLHHDAWSTPPPSQISENTPLLSVPKNVNYDARKIFREELVKLTRSGLPIFGYVGSASREL
jgi:hypothetical protein